MPFIRVRNQSAHVFIGVDYDPEVQRTPFSIFWAKSRGVPSWRLLLDLSPDEIVRLLDFSYLEDVLTEQDAIEILKQEQAARPSREPILERGYPGCDTSVGWFRYETSR
jgi:L-fuconate dehydratase